MNSSRLGTTHGWHEHPDPQRYIYKTPAPCSNSMDPQSLQNLKQQQCYSLHPYHILHPPTMMLQPAPHGLIFKYEPKFSSTDALC